MPSLPSNLAEFLEGGLEQQEEDVNRFFLWKNVEVPCVISGIQIGLSIGAGPKGEDITGRVIVRFSQFLTADSTLYTVDSTLFTVDNSKPTPVSGKLISIQGKSYRIMTATRDGTGSYVELNLTSPNK